MLLDLICDSSNVRFNSNLAQILGLHASIYISLLLDINNKAIKKNKVEDNYFKLDRKYVKDRSTLSYDEQKEIDELLEQLSIISRKGENCISVNITSITSIMMSPDESLINNIKKVIKEKAAAKGPKMTKEQMIVEALKQKVQCENQELKSAYDDWIEAVMAKQHWMSAKSVTVAQQVIDNYTQRNLDLAIALLNIASINGYRDIQWAINTYESESARNRRGYSLTTSSNNKESVKSKSELSDEVF